MHSIEKAVGITLQRIKVPSEVLAEFLIMADPNAVISEVPNLKRHSSVSGERLPQRYLILNRVRREYG